MTLLDVAKVVGYGERAVAAWEADLSVPDLVSLQRLARVLQCRIVVAEMQ